MKNLTKIIPASLVSLLVLLPMVAYAQFDGLEGFIDRAGDLVQQATILIAGVALLVFFWGLVKFISKAGDEGAIAEGRRLMIWGIITLFVMMSVWGLIYFISDQLQVGPDEPAPTLPTFPRP